MATIAENKSTLRDVVSADGGEAGALYVAEVLSQTNELLEDATFIECNSRNDHKSAIRTGLPAIAWRSINQGVQPSKSSQAKVTDSTGLMEGLSQVDESLIFNQAKLKQFRLDKDKPFIEAMNQEAMRVLVYGDDNVDPKKFLGLTPRFSTPSSDIHNSGSMLMDGGGTTVNGQTSIWFITWGDNKVNMLYPEGSKGGIERLDNGRLKFYDEFKGEFWGYETQFKWTLGLTVTDWEYVGRLCNVDIALLSSNKDYGDALLDKMIILSERVKRGGGKLAIYTNRRVLAVLRNAIRHQTVSTLTFETVEKKPVTMFDGIPIRRNDGILLTEPIISGDFLAA